mgnify:CR=1 FL=1|jgi:hypothetical protein
MGIETLTPEQVNDIITHAKLLIVTSKDWMDVHHEGVPTDIVVVYNELEEALDSAGLLEE